MWFFGGKKKEHDDEYDSDEYYDDEYETDSDVEDDDHEHDDHEDDEDEILKEDESEPPDETQAGDEKIAAVNGEPAEGEADPALETVDVANVAPATPRANVMERSTEEVEEAENSKPVKKTLPTDESGISEDVAEEDPQDEDYDDESYDPQDTASSSSEEDEESLEDADSGEEEEDEDDENDDEEDDDEDEEDDKQPTSLEEKQSLLALAVEHDRVDILKAILSDQADQHHREALLNHPEAPPLHVAVLFGSIHATSCLLRMGANPNLRPPKSSTSSQHNKDNPLARYHGISAWELAFGKKNEGNDNDDDDAQPQKTKSSWLGGVVSSSSKSLLIPVDMAPSKREGIRHAFTAEALRCIGSDEVERLRQLLDSGMPATIDIGGKTLHGWCVEMGAKECQELTRPYEEEEEDQQQQEKDKGSADQKKPAGAKKPGLPTPIMRRVSNPDDSLPSLANRLEELESLARALSTCLDNLAEEVSVCHGLLLLGGGASALAAHVRSLKALKERRQKELQHWSQEWVKGEEELASWIQQAGGNGAIDNIAASKLDGSSRKLSFINMSPETPEEEEAQRQQLTAQIGASENRIRKLRASITDLSEENARDLEEVERRGLSGGINLVRSLREEIREVEFQLSEAKSGEAACRAKIGLISSSIQGERNNVLVMEEEVSTNNGGYHHQDDDEQTRESVETTDTAPTNAAHIAKSLPRNDEDATSMTPAAESSREEKRPSERIAMGESDALVVRSSRPYLPLDIWQILLRIIGFRRDASSTSHPPPPPKSTGSESSTVMIV